MVPVALAFHLSAVEDMVHQFNLDLILICPLCFWLLYICQLLGMLELHCFCLVNLVCPG